MKNEVQPLLNKTNGNRIKYYYSLSELTHVTGMSIRSLKYRMKEIKNKFHSIPYLISKQGKQWRIHYTMVDLFKPKYKMSYSKLYDHHWSTMTTWNPKYNYDVEYHLEIISEVKVYLPDYSVAFVVEKDGRNINHSHIISDAPKELFDKVVKAVLNQYIETQSEYRIQTESINNQHAIVTYLQKASVVKGIMNNNNKNLKDGRENWKSGLLSNIKRTID
jgi:hypothetical protein